MTGGFHWQPMTHERPSSSWTTARGSRTGTCAGSTWLVLEDAELEPYLAAKNGPEPLGSDSPQLVGQAARTPKGAAEGRRPRPARRRRAREHLRGRGALARAGEAPCDLPTTSRARDRAGHASDPRCAANRYRAPGLDATRLRRSRWSVGLDAGRVPRLRPRRRAVLAMSNDHCEDARRRPWHLVLPALPALAVAAPTLAAWDGPTRLRRSCCGLSATGRPTGSSTCTPPTAAGSARSRKACARRSPASARGSSRSRTWSSSCTRAPVSCTRSPASRSSIRTTPRARMRTASRSGSSVRRPCCGSSSRRSATSVPSRR